MPGGEPGLGWGEGALRLLSLQAMRGGSSGAHGSQGSGRTDGQAECGSEVSDSLRCLGWTGLRAQVPEPGELVC